MIRINFFRIDIEGTLDMLIHYQSTMEYQMKDIQKSEQIKIERMLKSINDEDIYSAEVSVAGDEYHYTYEVMFPRSLNYSFIVLLFLNVENLLNKFCDEIRDKRGLPIRSNILKGDSVERSKVYLHKIAGIPEIDIQKWDNIEDLSKVRNCIVHTLGKVEQSNAQIRLRDIAKQGVGISIGEYSLDKGYLVLTDDYCKKCLSDVSSLFNELFDKAGIGPAYD